MPELVWTTTALDDLKAIDLWLSELGLQNWQRDDWRRCGSGRIFWRDFRTADASQAMGFVFWSSTKRPM